MTSSDWWNRTRYRLYAPVYDWLASPMERGRERAVEDLDLDRGDRVLLLGSGTGLDLEYLPAGVEVTAVDLTPAMVDRTAERAASLPVDVDARVGDARDLSLPDDAYDAVLLHLVLTVVPDPDAVVAEAARVLAPNGEVSIYDKFVPPGTTPSLARRAIDPVARVLFSNVTTHLDPLVDGTGLSVETRGHALRGLYTHAVARSATGD